MNRFVSPFVRAITSCIAAILCASLIMFPALFGQESRGTLTGVITDSAGAVVPAVTVTAVNRETNAVFSSQTSDAGLYTLPLLPLGHYLVTAAHEGFRRSERKDLEIRAGDRLLLDMQLEIGAVSESVSVTAQADLLEATASRSQVISSKAVSDLPYEGHNALLTSLLTPGVMFPNLDNQQNTRPFDTRGQDGMLINGGLQYRNNFTINGLANTASEDGSSPGMVTYSPPPDSVREVSVQTNSYDSQNGHTGGGTINVDLKTGGSQFHGSAYTYVKNTVFNANRWENNANGVKRAAYRWNQPGIELDGPLFIPRVYPGRNKTFFMFSWEAIHDSIPQPLTTTVPTADQRAGDFSKTTVNGLPIAIYDPTKTVQTAPGVYTRPQFTNNIIPADRIDPVAKKLLSYYPLPTSAGNADGLNNYFFGGSVVTDDYNAYTTTLDQVLNQANRLSFSYYQSDRQTPNPTYGFPDPAASPLYLHWRVNKGTSLTWTSVLSPTTVLDVRTGFERHEFAAQYYNSGFDPGTLGFPPSLVSQLVRPTFPQFVVTNYQTLGANTSSFTVTNTYSNQATLSKVIDKHSLKAGGQFNVTLNNYNAPTSSSGTYTFTSVFTQQSPLINNSREGNALASLLLGYPASGSIPNNAAFAYSSHYYALFLQDDWRVSSRLTVNLGLRWDVETPITERYNRLNAGFDLNAASPLQIAGLNLKGGLLFVNDKNRTGFKTDYNNIQPRAGAAFRFNNKTVMRGGFGIFYLPTFDNPGTQGFSVSTPYTASNDGNATPANSLSNPFPGGLIQPIGSSKGLASLLGTTITFGDPSRVIPKNLQFSLGFQRQLPGNIVADVSYVGSRTREIGVSQNLNATAVSDLGLGSALNSSVANPFQGLLPGTTLNNATITRQQLLLPYPQYTGITRNNVSIGHTWYNSMQVSLERRFSAGLFFLASYTLSKNMQAITYLNAQDVPAGEAGLARQLTATDVPHNVRISGGYELPFFRKSNGILRGALGGWQINTVFNWTSGTPLAAPTGAFSTGVDPGIANPTSAAWFNTCYLNLSGQRTNCASATQTPAWIQQPAFTLNTLTPLLPNIRISRPPLANASIFKTFAIRERIRLQIRAEAQNVANTVWFPAPNTTLTSPLFGQTTLATGGFQSTPNDPRIVTLNARVSF